jgi:hypothetical protein
LTTRAGVSVPLTAGDFAVMTGLALTCARIWTGQSPLGTPLASNTGQ